MVSNLIEKYGDLKAGLLCYAIVLLVSLIAGCMFYYVALGEINLVDVLAVMFFAAVCSPLLIMMTIQALKGLHSSRAYIESATQQEKLLNQTLKDNINRLNSEIDERKIALHAKHRAIDELRKEITERKKAQQALETAYKDKGKFIATLSHELRTPLNGIVGLTRMLLDTELNKQQRSWCNTVFSSAETLGNIFNDIIDLDKIDREQLDIAADSINVSDFINDVVNFAGLIADQKGLEFNIQRQGILDVYALLDPTRLRQVLWNLINNAVKFTHRGGVTLTCRRENLGSGPWLFISVIDTGVGIPEDQLEKIFDMYYKAPDATGANAIGSGIGLAVTKALIEAMHGTVSVSSKQGEGSRFEVKLPLKLTSAPKAQSYAGRSLNILLVEDVPLNAEIATNLLEQRGHEVIWAETGEDALCLVETEDDLDLILLDMQLPDINGDEVARQIREDSRFDDLPIVALTANVRSAEQELEGISVQGALAKPINTTRLDKMLGELFGINAQKHNDNKELKVYDSVNEVQAAHLDLETISDFVSSMGIQAFKRSTELFARLNPKYCQELKDALSKNDTQEYASVAHKMKGAAGSVGLLQVQVQAKQMELRASSETEDTLNAWIKELEAKINEGQEALRLSVAKLAEEDSV
ncbi:Aerobic respiration control sensor protein arcB [Pseudoalteromonas luteoviolacea B = ATCC 29581]|nr:Aerobic respiration control sensor protein arcB [Pseudoalteromonas luteoviolacea B = ATCC 29581]